MSPRSRVFNVVFLLSRNWPVVSPSFFFFIPEKSIHVRFFLSAPAVAVVLTFFMCWAPFHTQRLVAVYMDQGETPEESERFKNIFNFITYLSGVLYFMSTMINPILYHSMSNKFRDAFWVSEVAAGRPTKSAELPPERVGSPSHTRKCYFLPPGKLNSGCFSAGWK